MRTAEQLTRKRSFDSKTDRQDCHERFVRHGINHCPNHSLEVPSSGNPAIDQISDSSIRKESNCPGVVIVQHKIAYDGCSDEAGESQDVGESVDIFMGGELLEGTEDWPLRVCRRFAIQMSAFVGYPHVRKKKKGGECRIGSRGKTRRSMLG
jgi:hypothetical protein